LIYKDINTFLSHKNKTKQKKRVDKDKIIVVDCLYRVMTRKTRAIVLNMNDYKTKVYYSTLSFPFSNVFALFWKIKKTKKQKNKKTKKQKNKKQKNKKNQFIIPTFKTPLQ